MIMNKVTRDGKTAVLYSPGFGAGWSSWVSGKVATECLFDPDIVALVEAKASSTDIQVAAEAKWPNEYWGGASGLTIAWVDEGELFKIEEYDGSESIDYIFDIDWRMA